MNSKVNSLIDSLRFRTYNKVYRAVKERLHDKRPPNRIKRLYQVKIFSRFDGQWKFRKGNPEILANIHQY